MTTATKEKKVKKTKANGLHMTNALDDANAELKRIIVIIENKYLKPRGATFGNGINILPIIQTNGRSKNVMGHVECGQLWHEGKDGYHEFQLSAEFLNLSYMEKVAIIMHELIHVYCLAHNIKDTSSSGAYHNNRFKQVAIDLFGMMVEKHQTRGWQTTSLSPKVEAQLADILDADEKAFRIYKEQRPQSKPKSPTKMLKWTCGGGCTNVRCATQLIAKCEQCHEQFELA
jgi:hypothetical protein